MSEILKLMPVFKDYIWGGQRLKKEYSVTDMDRVAEAWILSSHRDGQSIVSGGSYDGMKFGDVLKSMGRMALGKNADLFDEFPQLIKLIDAKENLSVQVHPDDEYALLHEGQYGKTEMWYILNADQDAGLYLGFKNDISLEDFKNCIENNTLTNVINFIPVKKGESYLINSGTLHAIGKGLLIAEIQQNSNITYRVYDYGRIDVDGKQRQLHIDQALAVTKRSKYAPDENKCFEILPNGKRQRLYECKYFKVSSLEIDGSINVCEMNSFTIFLAIEGEGTINGQKFKKFDTFFIPADFGNVTIKGNFKALLSQI